MMNLLQEKDAKIATLESSFEETKMILEKTLKDSEVGMSSKQKFKCDLCEFKSTSTNGLKTHIARKHTKYSEDRKQIKCEICSQHLFFFQEKSKNFRKMKLNICRKKKVWLLQIWRQMSL